MRKAELSHLWTKATHSAHSLSNVFAVRLYNNSGVCIQRTEKL